MDLVLNNAVKLSNPIAFDTNYDIPGCQLDTIEDIVTNILDRLS